MLEGELDEFTAALQDDEKRRGLEAQAAQAADARRRSRASPSREALDSARRRARRRRASTRRGWTPRCCSATRSASTAPRCGSIRDREVDGRRGARVPRRGPAARGRARAGRLPRRAQGLPPPRAARSTRACSSRGRRPSTSSRRARRCRSGARVHRRRHGQRRGRAGAQGRAARPRRVSATDVSAGRAGGRARQRRAPRPRRRRSRRATCSTASTATSTPSSPTRPTSQDGDRATLAPEVARHEPGARAVRRRRRPATCCAALAPAAAASGATLVALEVGAGQAPAVRALVARGGLRRTSRRVATWPGIERVVVGVGDDHRRATPRPSSAACRSAASRSSAPTPSTAWPASPTPTRRSQRLYALKGRRPDKPAAVMFFSLELALAALPELGPRTARALEALLPGAVTLLLPNPARPLPAGLRAGRRRRSACACPRWPPAARRAGRRALAGAAVLAPTPPAAPMRARLADVPGGDPRRAPTWSSTAASCPARRRPWSTCGASSTTALGRRARGRGRRPPRGVDGGARFARVTAAFVTGGSGFIGGALIRRLVADGIDVRRPRAQRRRRRGRSRALGADADRRRPRRRARRCRGRRAVLRAWPSTAPRTSATGARARSSSAVNVEGTRNVAGRRAPGAACGASSTSAPRPCCWPASRCVEVDERAPLRFDSPALYSSTKARAEAAVARGRRRRPETVVVRPRSCGAAATRRCCPRSPTRSRAGRFAWIGGGRHRTSTTHVDNAVAGPACSPPARRARRRLLRHRRRRRSSSASSSRACWPPQGVDAAARARVPAPVARALAATGETAWRALPLPGRPPLTRLAV